MTAHERDDLGSQEDHARGGWDGERKGGVKHAPHRLPISLGVLAGIGREHREDGEGEEGEEEYHEVDHPVRDTLDGDIGGRAEQREDDRVGLVVNLAENRDDKDRNRGSQQRPRQVRIEREAQGYHPARAQPAPAKANDIRGGDDADNRVIEGLAIELIPAAEDEDQRDASQHEDPAGKVGIGWNIEPQLDLEEDIEALADRGEQGRDAEYERTKFRFLGIWQEEDQRDTTSEDNGRRDGPYCKDPVGEIRAGVRN
jgi:hypothetical protein